MAVQATYRKARHSELWHFCMNCGDWPAKDFDELSSTQNQPREQICAECTELQRRELCQSSAEVAP